MRLPRLVLLAPFLAATATLAAEPAWQRIQLDDTFRAEGAAVGDFNRDGKLDVSAGEFLYLAPDWKPTEVLPPGKYVYDQGYSNSFASWAFDVNQDGWDDIIHVRFPGQPCHWLENPQGQPGHWKQHEIWHSACNETVLFVDITGDGKPELVMGSQPERQIGFLEVPPPDKCRDKWTFHAISEAGEPGQNGSHHFYHGLGTGDINGDGRRDVLIPHGWWEAPMDRRAGLWRFHPWSLSKNNQGNPLPAANLQAIDLDLDGDNDVVMTSAHQYGVWWFENPGGDFTNPFKFHLIDESLSQTHALELVDLHGDGVPALVTGKRFFAHNGKGDPGEHDPVLIVYYDILRHRGQPPTFVRHEIEAGLGTGIGTQFTVQDLNRDGTLDLILANKKGVNLLLQQRVR